ncbi:hypothetical protein MPC1_6660003 [Methylocella tundrae]|nr:hypothetical protein MPC1_6660003 [Methylocella tundrae]
MEITQKLLRTESANREVEHALLTLQQIRERLRHGVGVVDAKAECKRIAEKDDRPPALRRNRAPQQFRIEGVVGSIDFCACLRIDPLCVVDPRMFHTPAKHGFIDRPAGSHDQQLLRLDEPCCGLHHAKAEETRGEYYQRVTQTASRERGEIRDAEEDENEAQQPKNWKGLLHLHPGDESDQNGDRPDAEPSGDRAWHQL